jgi:hypothetical protein
MKTDSKNKLQPQIKEDITKAVWLKKEEVKEVMNSTYPSINYLIFSWFKWK